MSPAFATRSKVCELPLVVPGVQTMPMGGAPAGSAVACPGAASRAETVSRATAGPSRRARLMLLRVMVAFPRGAGSVARRADARAGSDIAGSDIGLPHHLLRGQPVLVHPHFRHHPARAGSAVVRELPPVAVAEVVDVVAAAPVAAGGVRTVVGRRD